MQLEKGEKNNGTRKESKKPKSMGQAEMENQIWEEVFGNWGKIFARESYQESIICRVCGNDKSKRQGTKKGKQFVKQPKGIAKKTAKYRRYK